jgi:hypothetical protein
MPNHLPNHLQPRREKIFGPAPEHRLDGNAKARVWAAAAAYNTQHRQPPQHRGPLTRATMDVLKALLWRFHGADGGGRCFPSFERIAAAAKCCRDTAIEAVKALEAAGLLTWVHRITRVRRRELDLLGHLITVWQVIRTSNAYRFIDPLSREPGRRGYKSENPAGPQNQDLTRTGARLVGAQVMQEEPSQAPPVRPERLEVAPQQEHGSAVGARLSPAERAALIDRLDIKPTKADWALYGCELEARLLQTRSPQRRDTTPARDCTAPCGATACASGAANLLSVSAKRRR